MSPGSGRRSMEEVGLQSPISVFFRMLANENTEYPRHVEENLKTPTIHHSCCPTLSLSEAGDTKATKESNVNHGCQEIKISKDTKRATGTNGTKLKPSIVERT